MSPLTVIYFIKGTNTNVSTDFMRKTPEKKHEKTAGNNSSGFNSTT